MLELAAGLPARWRYVVEQIYIQGRKYADVGQELGVSKQCGSRSPARRSGTEAAPRGCRHRRVIACFEGTTAGIRSSEMPSSDATSATYRETHDVCADSRSPDRRLDASADRSVSCVRVEFVVGRELTRRDRRGDDDSVARTLRRSNMAPCSR